MTKQVIVMRTDLNMRRGKQIAQGAHASLKVILDMMSDMKIQSGVIKTLNVMKDTSLDKWLSGAFTKICVGIDSEEKLREIYNKAQEAGLPCAYIVDNGKTEFNGVPTVTCCAIGPAYSEDIDKITGDLKLL